MKTIKATALLAMVMLMLTGCSRRVADLAIVSTQTPEYGNIVNAPVVQDIVGNDSRTWFLIFPLSGSPNFEDAIDEAMTKVNGDFMVNAKAYKGFWTCILFSGDSVKIVGDVGNSRGDNKLKPPAK